MMNRRHALTLSLVAIAAAALLAGCASMTPQQQQRAVSIGQSIADGVSAAGAAIIPANPAIGGAVLGLGSLLSWGVGKAAASLTARKVRGGPLFERRQTTRAPGDVWGPAKRRRVLQLLSDDPAAQTAFAPRAPGGDP